MKLTTKEVNYLNKILSSNPNVDFEVIMNTLNRKRDEDNKLSIDDVMNFLDLQNENPNSLTNKQIKKADDLKQSAELDKSAYNALFITNHIISHLQREIRNLYKPPSPKEYKILSGKTQAALNQEVRNYIKTGWEPLGGVSAAAFGISPVGGNQYIQAMVRY